MNATRKGDLSQKLLSTESEKWDWAECLTGGNLSKPRKNIPISPSGQSVGNPNKLPPLSPLARASMGMGVAQFEEQADG